MDARARDIWPQAGGGRESRVLPFAVEQGLRLRTLVRLRWLAVIGQTGAVLAVHFLLGYRLPLGPCLAAIALSAWLNIFFSLRWRTSVHLPAQYAALLLGYDIIQLAVLLYLTGGLENPFAFLFVVPVTVSATSLPLKWTLWLGALSFACATFLAAYHFPLPWTGTPGLELPPVYIGGMWTALISGVVFSALYARRISEEARQMSQALTATELVLAREQRLSALDGLAAAAAHELGTPLATIALVAKELKRELKSPGPMADDIDLLISQASRCRDILSKLATREDPSDDPFARTTFRVMIEDIVTPQRGPDVAVEIATGPATPSGGGPEPLLRRNPAVTYGLSNLIENAIDFAASRVRIDVRWTAADIRVAVADDGPGFAQEVLDRLGDPFVTTRQGYGPEAAEPGTHEGMGLGFFIAKTLLERSGAEVTLANKPPPDHGAIVEITWPRARIDVAEPARSG